MDNERLDAIAEGFGVNCPECGTALEIEKQTGATGAVGYHYRCGKKGCKLPPGFAYVPWTRVMRNSLQSRMVHLCLTAIGSVTLAGAIGVATGLVGRPANTDFSQHLENLLEHAPNNYARNAYAEIQRRYDLVTNGNRIDFSLGRENPFEMARAADAAKHSIEAISAYSGHGWGGELDPYLLANRRAMERGVKVTRTFIVPYAFKDRPEELKELVRVMGEQNAAGFTVYYAYELELKSTDFYRDQPFYSCALFDGAFLGWDLRTETFEGGSFPAEIRITWDQKEIEAKSPFPNIYVSKYVHRFTDSSAAEIGERLRAYRGDSDAGRGLTSRDQ